MTNPMHDDRQDNNQMYLKIITDRIQTYRALGKVAAAAFLQDVTEHLPASKRMELSVDREFTHLLHPEMPKVTFGKGDWVLAVPVPKVRFSRTESVEGETLIYDGADIVLIGVVHTLLALDASGATYIARVEQNYPPERQKVIGKHVADLPLVERLTKLKAFEASFVDRLNNYEGKSR